MSEMTGVTAKQSAASLRKQLDKARDAADRGGYTRLTNWNGDVHETRIPAGLRFTVRATRAAINVTVHDAGYVDTVTNGNRAAWEGPVSQHHTAAVVEQVEALERFMFGQTLGKVEFGPVVLSVAMTGSTRISPMTA